MRIIVMSDSHSSYDAVLKIISRQPDADMYIHLGDGASECNRLKREFPDKKFFFIKGNCDFSCEFPDELIIPVNGNHRIFATHGHNYSVKYTLNSLLYAGMEQHCDILLYGHTHVSYNHFQDGIHILNPGSCAIPREGLPRSYAFIDITENGEIFKSIVSL